MPRIPSHSSSRSNGQHRRHHHSSHHHDASDATASLSHDAARARAVASRLARVPVASSAHASSEATRRHSRHKSPPLDSVSAKGKNAATGCVLSAFLGLLIEILNELVAGTGHTNTNTFFNILTVCLAAAALVTGIYAQMIQLRRWSRQTRQRILIGLPVALLTLITVIPNFFEKPSLGNMERGAPHAAKAPLPPADTRETDESLVKPGWYGELQRDGFLLIVSSFEENASESRQFNRRLFKPVSYATFTVINLGSATPIALNSLQVKAQLDTGEVTQSLPIEPLLSQNAQANRDLVRRLALPQQLAIGGMIPDVPICMQLGFSWSRVIAVTVTLGGREVTVPGRVMTAEEKKAFLDKSTAERPAASNSNGSAESWYKGL